MKIIDFEKKGNIVRFYLGQETKEYGWVNPKSLKDGEQPRHIESPWGDDWDDAPYDCNAGVVYSEYVYGYADIVFPFDALVLEPCQCGFRDSCYVSKEDMQQRKVPCIVAVMPEALGIDNIFDYVFRENFYDWCGSDKQGVYKYYFGDEMKPMHLGTGIDTPHDWYVD